MMKHCLFLALLCAFLTVFALAESLPQPFDGCHFNNAPLPLALTSCYGTVQNVHPKVLYLPQGFGGHTWWMAYTPYTNGSSAQENPCIAWSDDGYAWTNIPGNPIDVPSTQINGYLSDAHLVCRDGMLECWYRLADRGGKREVIYRKTSADGVHWSSREQLHDTGREPGELYCLSPAVLWDGEQYCIWYVVSTGKDPDKSSQYIQYCTSADGADWQPQHRINLSYRDGKLRYRLWHIDVLQEDGAYIITAMAKGGSKDRDGTSAQTWSLFVTTSQDNINYTEPALLLKGTRHGWDRYMYRACMVKADTGYRLYYSALNDQRAHYIGISDEVR